MNLIYIGALVLILLLAWIIFLVVRAVILWFVSPSFRKSTQQDQPLPTGRLRAFPKRDKFGRAK